MKIAIVDDNKADRIWLMDSIELIRDKKCFMKDSMFSGQMSSGSWKDCRTARRGRAGAKA